jgi:hypothetical protein
VDDTPVGLAADEDELFAVGPDLGTISGAPRDRIGGIDLATGAVSPWAPAMAAGPGPHAIAVSPTRGALVGGDAVAGSGQGILSLFAISPGAPAAPQATASAPGQATVAFTSPPDGGAPITQYTVTAQPGGATGTGAQSPIAVGGLSPGTTYTFTVKAANAAGQSPASASSNPVTVLAAPSPAPGGSGGPAPPTGGGGTTAAASPVRASAFKVTHKRFTVARAATALIAATTPKGTTFTFRLSAGAVSKITIARRLPGVRKGGRCVAPRKGARRRCTRYKPVGSLTRRRTKAGANKVPFTGRLGKKALATGTYRATLVATDAAGHHSQARTATFVVVRAKKRQV